MFTAMDGLPVTLRLLDPPMHEFMPKPGRELEGLLGELAAEFKESEGRLAEIVEELREVCTICVCFCGFSCSSIKAEEEDR